MTQLEGWLRTANEPSATRGDLRRVVGDVQALQPTLSGYPLAESYYVEMIAFVALDDKPGACRAAQRVKDVHPEQARKNIADGVLTNCQ